MRIVIVAPWAQRLGGAEEVLLRLGAELTRRGHELTVALPERGPLGDALVLAGAAVVVLPFSRLRDPRAVVRAHRDVVRLIERTAPALAVAWMPKSQLLIALAARHAGVPLVWWQHGVPDGHWMDRMATALPAVGVVCSSHAAARAQRRLRPRRTTWTVHPGLPPVADRLDRAAARQALGLPHDRLVVGCVGRLQPWKGQDRVLRATAAARDHGHDVHVALVGGDSYGLAPAYPAELRALADDLGLGDRVTFTGHVEDSARYVGAFDVSVCASDTEPFGLVVIEAMAAGVPVVAAASGGPAEILEGDVGGVLVPGGPDALAPALEGLLADPALRERMGEAGRRRAVKRFGEVAMGDAFEVVLRAVA